MFRYLARCLGLFSVLSLPLVAQQRVLIVDDDGPSADYKRLSTAVEAAAPGSVIRVRAGSYGVNGPREEIVIDGKAVLITAEAGAQVDVRGHVVVRNTAAIQSVTLSGLSIQVDDFATPTAAVQVVDAHGAVWIERCDLSTNPITQAVRQVALVVERSDQVVLIGTRVATRTFPLDLSPGSPGIEARASRLHVFDSVIDGGEGGSNGLGLTSEGGPGVQLETSFAYLSDTVVTGGPGSPGQNGANCVDGGPGGPGAVLVGTGPELRTSNTRLLGGPGGVPVGTGTCNPGPSGPPTRVSAGTLSQVPASARSFEVEPTAVAPGEPFELRFQGEPFECALLLVSPAPRAAYLAGLGGTLALGGPILIGRPGFLDAAGKLTMSLSINPAADLQAAWMQAVFLQPTSLHMGPPATIQLIAPNQVGSRPKDR